MFQIWNNVATFRGRCKTAGQKAIDVHFRDELVPNVTEFFGGFGQGEYEQKVADNVASLIHRGYFHTNGKDEKVGLVK